MTGYVNKIIFVREREKKFVTVVKQFPENFHKTETC